MRVCVGVGLCVIVFVLISVFVRINVHVLYFSHICSVNVLVSSVLLFVVSTLVSSLQ